MVEYAAMKPIATDTHDFPSLRRNGCIYVDKTKYIHRLVSTIGSKLYFLSRPRRFEKSLTVSALTALFQARRELEAYTLGVPDEEVRRDLCILMAGVAANKDMQWASSLGKKLLVGCWDEFSLGIKSLYAAMAYDSTEGRIHENSYARCLSFLLAGSGFRFTMEDVQASGRADIVASHVNGVYIFELKVGESVDKAFRQIREKGYATPYLASGLPIHFIGLSFDPATRQLVDCAVQEMGER